MDRNGYLMIILILAMWTRIEGAGYCSPGSQVIKSCTEGSVSGSRLFLDVGGKTTKAQSCNCQLTTSAEQITANLVDAPGYNGCGISAQFSTNSIITYNCQVGGTFINTSNSAPISITANKSEINYEIPYCLMIQIPQGVSGALTLSCKSSSTSTSMLPTSETMTTSTSTTDLEIASSPISSSSVTRVTNTVQTQTDSSVISTMLNSKAVTSDFQMSATPMSSTILPTSSLRASTAYATEYVSTQQYNTLTTVTMSTNTGIKQSDITPSSTISAVLTSNPTQSPVGETDVKISSSSTTQQYGTTQIMSSMANLEPTDAASATPTVESHLASDITPTESVFLSVSGSDGANIVSFTDKESQKSTAMMQATSTFEVMTSSVEFNQPVSETSSQAIQTDSTDNLKSVTTESIAKTTPGSSRKNDGIIAVAVIGTLVGLGLIIFLIGAIYYKNRQRRRGSYSREKSAYLNYAADIDAEGVAAPSNGNAGNSYSPDETPQIVPYDDRK